MRRNKKKRGSRVLSFGLSIVVFACLCVSSVIDVCAASSYSSIFTDSYNVMSFADATDATISMTASGSTYATWRGTSQNGSASDWLFEFFLEPNDFLANLNYSNRNHVTWRVSLWRSYAGKYDKDGLFININSQYYLSNAIYPSRIIDDGTGYTSFYFDFDLPSYVADLNYIALYIPFTAAQASVAVETYEFKVVSYGEADEIIEQFGSNYSYPSTGGIDDYYAQESETLDKVGSYMQEAQDNWAGIGDLMGQYAGGFGAVRSMINELTSIPFFQILLMISLAVGSCLLLLGIALSAGRRGR